MSQTPLCQLPPAPAAGCGCGAAPLAVFPTDIDNPPGLVGIAYRIGTFTSFRQAMLDRVAAPDLLDAAPNPFLGWRPGTDGDYHTFFIELWAYLAGILTFYQERIANEAYIGTATQRDSALRLVELIAYRPSPGAAASGVASFNVAPGKVVTVPAGFRIGSSAQPGKPAATFETSSAVTARAEHNSIPLSSVAPVNQFAVLTNIQLIYGGVGTAALLDAAKDLYGSAAATFVNTLSFIGIRAAAASFSAPASLTAEPPAQVQAAPTASAAFATSRGIASIAASKLSTGTSFSAGSGLVSKGPNILTTGSSPFSSGPSLGTQAGNSGDFTSQRYPFYSVTTRTVVLAGTNHRLHGGDYVLTVENDTTATVFQISSVSTDTTAKTTTITWREPSTKRFDSSTQPVALFALRVTAAPFGSDAPAWVTLAPSLTLPPPPTAPPQSWPPTPPFQDNWDQSDKPGFYMPAVATVDLDSVYEAARGTPQNPGWVVLLANGADPSTATSLQFNEARAMNLSGYSIVKKVTRLSLVSGSVPASTFPVRDTLVLTGSEQLPLQNDLPLPDLLQGDTLILAGLYPNLRDGQPAIVQGKVYNPSGPATEPSAEYHTIKGQPVQDTVNNLTTIQIDKPLDNQYSRASASLFANLVPFTQGQTVADEVLGNGNGAPNQSFALDKSPLTYLPSTDPTSQSPVQSTLIVQVNGVASEETPSLIKSGAGARQYSLTEDNSGQTTVTFGDGTHGAAPPTGVGNVHARYRVGLGQSGNVPAGGVSALVDSIAGLQQVANPQPTLGGTDAESLARISVNAPGSVRAFNRAVSTEDYADLALTFPGIAKAGASWVSAGNAQPYVQLTVATASETGIAGTFAAQLRDFLDQRRDVNVPLRVVSFTPVYVNFAVTVDIQDQYPRQATLSAVEAALNPGVNADGSAGYFAFDRLGFGQSLHLSALYAVIQAVPGVANALITQFNIAGADSPVTNDILVGPTQIAMIGNDPNHPEQGLMTVTLGNGGFADK